ncbi:cytochrome P450 [Nocardia australiensis]|uniref:cytochrome P450 n=1 Tax=Nocardia australiensis TaxID=2887191 RepID=UPI001D13512D|nr:cytochrome P450 [Nocardia australiensis]
MTDANPGEIFTPHNATHRNSPDTYLQNARAQCPVSRASDVLYVVSRDEDVRRIFTDQQHFSSRGNFTLGEQDLEVPVPLITMTDPPVHTGLRKRLLKNFAPARLRKLEPEIAKVVADAVGELETQSGTVDLYDRYIKSIPTRVLYAFIGIPREMWDTVQEWADIINESLLSAPEETTEYARLTQYIGELVEERRSMPDNRHTDVLDNFCFADEGEREMSSFEVVMHIWQLLGAGTDTTRALMSNCVFRLLESHDQWDQIVADRSRLTNAIEESLRLDSPGTYMTRSVLSDVEIGGCPVQAGSKVYLSLQSANHDEKVWGDDSLEFNSSRAGAAAHVAFGNGIHACLGAPLVRIEARIAISALMDRFPNLYLAPGITWRNIDSYLFRRAEDIAVVL